MVNQIRFDSKAVPLNSLSDAREKARDEKIREVWSLIVASRHGSTEFTDVELTVLAVLEKIINRSVIGILSQSLESQLHTLAQNSSKLIIDRHQNYLDWVLYAHQLQCALVELVKDGLITSSTHIHVTDEGKTSVYLTAVGVLALEDLQELAEAVSDLYGCENPFAHFAITETLGGNDFVIDRVSAKGGAGRGDAAITGLSEAKAREQIAFIPMRIDTPVPTYPNRRTLEFLLNYIFRFREFREGQYEALVRALERKDTIVLLPTGSGKSVIFQLVALVSPGTSFIVAPIISLIDDQVQNLEAKGIDRVVGLTGNVRNKSTVEKGLAEGLYWMCYVSPERFQIESFLESVRKYSAERLVPVVAIDEAHCVSEWGHDFRASYLGLAKTSRDVCSTKGQIPPLLALTGTASLSVLTDMKHDLGIDEPGSIIKPKNFDRPEIHYRVIAAKSSEKMKALSTVLKETLPHDFNMPSKGFYDATQDEDTMSGIVFCQNVNGNYGIMNSWKAVRYGHPGVLDFLKEAFPDRCSYYCGKRPRSLRGVTEQEWANIKSYQAARFKQNETSIMVATKAFGMGIDKPNIRWIVHFGIPGSLESYYQEVGRAARDRNVSYAYLILSDDYPELNNSALDPTLSDLRRIKSLEERKSPYKGDDVSRCLFFHQSTFTGIDDELKVAEKLLEQCETSTDKEGRWHIPYSDSAKYKSSESNEDEKNKVERTIYRLTLLGVFESYTVDYTRRGHGEFVIEPAKVHGADLRNLLIRNYLSYIRSYQSDVAFLESSRKSLEKEVDGIKDDREFILRTLRHLLENFTYKVIEEGRRRALRTMLMSARKASKITNEQSADDTFRKDIVSYLSAENFDDENDIGLSSIINDATNVDKLLSVIDQTRLWMDPSALLAQSLRLLEDYPQHYGFYYILCAMQAFQGNAEEALSSAKTMVHYGVENYGLTERQCAASFIRFLKSETGKSIPIEVQDELVNYLAEAAGQRTETLLRKLATKKAQTMLNLRQLSTLAREIDRGLR